jgi:ATP-dependent 26S proteasome regulatory subunit
MITTLEVSHLRRGTWRGRANFCGELVRLLREELGLLQQPGSYVGEVVKVMSTKKVLVKVQPEGKYGRYYLRASTPLSV